MTGTPNAAERKKVMNVYACINTYWASGRQWPKKKDGVRRRVSQFAVGFGKGRLRLVRPSIRSGEGSPKGLLFTEVKLRVIPVSAGKGS